MQFPSRSITLGLSILAGLSIALGACSSGSDDTQLAPVPPTSAPASADPLVAGACFDSNADGTNQDEADVYLKSQTRNSSYERLVPKAGPKIAQALENGMFGPTERYNDWKNNLTPDYVGNGGISTLDHHYFAWVYWNKGRIDYTKPIRQIAIANRNGVLTTQIALSEPMDSHDYWDVSQQETSQCQVVSANIGLPYAGELSWTPSHDNYFTYPSSVAALRTLDANVYTQLQMNMDSWFGQDWDK